MSKTQYVTITLDEYKELLMKEKPTNRDHEIVERVYGEIEKHLLYSDSRYNSGHVGDDMKVDNPTEIIYEIMLMTKYLDFDRYMKMWNSVQSNERKRKAMREQIDQMNKAKEMRQGE